MAINNFKNIAEYAKIWSKRRLAMKKSNKKSTFQAALYMKANAIKLAPLKTGQLISGINQHPTPKGRIVESVVHKDFPYNMYVNGNIEAIEYKKSNKYLGIKKGDVIAYGLLGPKHWKWTGHRGYFSKAILMTKKRFPQITRQNMLSALRVRV
jgi:hypothetical protein